MVAKRTNKGFGHKDVVAARNAKMAVENQGETAIRSTASSLAEIAKGLFNPKGTIAPRLLRLVNAIDRVADMAVRVEKRDARDKKAAERKTARTARITARIKALQDQLAKASK